MYVYTYQKNWIREKKQKNKSVRKQREFSEKNGRENYPKGKKLSVDGEDKRRLRNRRFGFSFLLIEFCLYKESVSIYEKGETRWGGVGVKGGGGY